MPNDRIARLTHDDRWVVSLFDMITRVMALTGMSNSQELQDLQEMLEWEQKKANDQADEKVYGLMLDMIKAYREDNELPPSKNR